MRWIAVVVLAACGRLGFDPTATDGRVDPVDDAPPPDAPPPTGMFGMPMPMPGINSASADDDPTLTGDMLVIVFDSKRGGGVGAGDLWASTRASLDAPWSMPVNVAELNTAADDTTPDLSRDGLALYFATTRVDSVGAKDIYVSRRENRDALWGMPARIGEVSSTGDEAGPAISFDQRSLYLASDRGGNDDIYSSDLNPGSDRWSPAARVDELATSAVEGEPWVSPDRLYIVFSSTRPGSQGSDLWEARRTSTTLPFDPPTRIAELCTTGTEADPWLSPDQRTIVFMRDDDIYFATR